MSLSDSHDSAYAAMTLDILGNILSRAENPGELGLYISEEIRELTGSRCVILLQCDGQEGTAIPTVITVNPKRRKPWSDSVAARAFFQAVKQTPAVHIWRGNEPTEEARLLHREEFDLTLSIPLCVGSIRVGSILVLGLPDELHLQSLIKLLSDLSTTLALVIRNAFLFEKQEEIIRDRTLVLHETNQKLQVELAERTAAQDRVVRITRLYAALSQCNEAIIHSDSQETLFPQICQNIVKLGGMKMAWIGTVDPSSLDVHPVASAGSGTEYLKGIEISTDPKNPTSYGPAGLAIRENRPIWSQDFQQDPKTTPWHEQAKPYGWAANAGLPLCLRGVPIGCLGIYSDKPQAFDEEERRLFVEMATNISFALDLFANEDQRKQIEEAMRRAKAEAENANQSKDQFIAVLSHELRTPLTPVLALVTSMNEEPNLAPSTQANLQLIRQNVELEVRLIDDLLDITRIAHGKLKLIPKPMDLHHCIQMALKICQSEIQTKGLKLTLHLEAYRHHVLGDSTRLRQAFWNLLNNAEKFTPSGGRIDIKSANVKDRLIIEITDTGIGIKPELIPQIFDHFKQGEQTKTRQFGGLGLGLSIAKAVIEMHGGNLIALSEGHGKGATFIVELDTVVAPVPIPSTPLAPAPVVKIGQDQRLLLVEDHLDTQRVLSKLINHWGYSVTTADSVKSALEAAKERPFDLLVSDLGLPDGTGLEVIQLLKKQSNLRGIAVSGFGTEEDIRKSLAAGFEEHLTKPVNLPALKQAIQRLGTS